MSHIPGSPNVSLFWLCPLAYRVPLDEAQDPVNLYALLFPSLVMAIFYFRPVYLYITIYSFHLFPSIEKISRVFFLNSFSFYYVRYRTLRMGKEIYHVIRLELEKSRVIPKERKKKGNNRYRSLFDRATSNR